MEKIGKNDLLKLGFIEEYSSPEQSGTENGFYFYTYSINNMTILISNASDECNDDYTIEFFDYNDSIQIKNINCLKSLIKILNNNKKDGKKNK